MHLVQDVILHASVKPDEERLSGLKYSNLNLTALYFIFTSHIYRGCQKGVVLLLISYSAIF